MASAWPRGTVAQEPTILERIVAALVGMLAGAHASTWGAYRDAPHEGFAWKTYFRSIALGGVLGPAVLWGAGLDAFDAGHLVLLWGVIYVAERGITEFYTVYVRDEDQSKYSIPMQLHILGAVVRDSRRRLAMGLAHIAVVIGLIFVVRGIQEGLGARSPSLWLVLAVGSLGGWVSALGGAWKDAPIEGFRWPKFFRSPAVAALYSLLLFRFTDRLLLIALAAAGYAVATLETWKTLSRPSRPGGKFAGKPITCPRMLELRRRYLMPLFLLIWCVVATGIVIALTTRDEAPREPPSAGDQGSSTAITWIVAGSSPSSLRGTLPARTTVRPCAARSRSSASAAATRR